MKRRSMPFFLLVLLLYANSITASSKRHDSTRINLLLSDQEIQHDLYGEERKLSAFALYNLDAFSVRFYTGRTAELESARSSVLLEQGTNSGDIGDGWMLISETGGLQSSLSYPIRSVTQEFLFLAFQNLVNDWKLELSGGPDGNNYVDYHTNTVNNDEGLNNRLLTGRARQQKPERITQVINIAGGEYTGEEDYNADKRDNYDNTITGSEIDIVKQTSSANEPTDSLLTTQDHQQSDLLLAEATSVEASTYDLDIPQDEMGSSQIELPLANATTNSSSTTQDEQQGGSPQTTETTSFQPSANPYLIEEDSATSEVEATEVPTSTDYVYSTQEELQPESPKVKYDPAREPSDTSQYVDLYDGLVYHNMYGHLVTVDLRVKLYLRRDGYSTDEDSLRRNLRKLQTDEAELMAEMTPTIAFKEPVSQEDILSKPSNDDVKNLFGVWMEYLFGKQRDIYIRTLREYQNQDMLQEISRLRVDVGVSASPSASSDNSYTAAWSEKTQRVLMILVVFLGIVAVIWPMFTWVQHIKKDRALSLQLLHGGLSLGGEYGDDLSDSFSSVTYRDNVHDMVKLPPINPSVAPPDSSLPRPNAISSMIERVHSLDAARHGKDVFPSNSRNDSQKSAMSVLEASDRYLFRNRPDLYYDQQASEKKGTVNVFGRSYEIPSNPFEFIFNGGQEDVSPLADNFSPQSKGFDLGQGAHFPFGSPRSSFTARASSVGSNPFPGRSTSVASNPFPTGSIGNNNTNSANHFTPIVVSNQNLAAGMNEELEDELEGNSWNMTAPGIATHTGHTWQNHDISVGSSRHVHPSYSNEGSSTGVLGNIFRNLSISSWYSGNNMNNSYTSNNPLDPDFNPSKSSGTEEVYYDNYHYEHRDPSFLQSEIELESLPNDEEDPANYDFAFQDFPRKDGTPCLIIDDNSFLSERKRRESIKAIFNIDDDADAGIASIGSLSEKNLDDLPSSDEAFKLMLSQNALEIDNSILKVGDGDESMELPPLEGSFLSQDAYDAKSPEFQKKLTRLFETKQQRYTRENKNAAIVAANRKKRKNVRERERVDRHKAIERELEDIEAEFSLTMQPMSPDRNKNIKSSSIHGRTTPKRNTHSPKPSTGRFSPMPSRMAHSPKTSTGRFSPMPSRRAPSPKPTTGRYSPMPSRRAPSPARKNIATLSPSRPNLSHSRRAPSPAPKNMATLSPSRLNLSGISVSSPARSNSLRGRGSGHMRHNSSGGGHRKQNSLGASPFRKLSPRTRFPNSDVSRQQGSRGGAFRSEETSQSASHRSMSPPDIASAFDGPMLEYRPRSRGQYDDLSLPSMTATGEKSLESSDAKFPSPQAVIDEALQSGTQNTMKKSRHFSQPKRHHQRSLTPTRMTPTPSAQHNYIQRRTNSFDVNDATYHRRIQSGSSHSTASSQLPQHSVIRQSHSTLSNTNSGHRRVPSGGMGSNHKRSKSRDEDIFLHGVVAQTRLI